MSLATVCVVGSINADRFVGLEHLPEPGETVLGEALGLHPGGKGFNQAVAAARCGAATRMCGAIGDDVEAGFLRGVMEAAGVNGDAVSAVAGASGTAYVFSLPGGENSIVVASGANRLVDGEAAAEAARGADVVLVQLEIDPAVARRALESGRESGALTVLNAAPAHPAALEMLAFVDVLVVNDGEAEALGGIDALRDAVTVIRTRGAAGSIVYPLGEEPFEVVAFRIEPVDTTGAGDAFCGGLAAALARGEALEGAVREGSAAGAIVAQHRGAQTDALSREAIHRLIGTLQPRPVPPKA